MPHIKGWDPIGKKVWPSNKTLKTALGHFDHMWLQKAKHFTFFDHTKWSSVIIDIHIVQNTLTAFQYILYFIRPWNILMLTSKHPFYMKTIVSLAPKMPTKRCPVTLFLLRHHMIWILSDNHTVSGKKLYIDNRVIMCSNNF